MLHVACRMLHVARQRRNYSLFVALSLMGLAQQESGPRWILRLVRLYHIYVCLLALSVERRAFHVQQALRTPEVRPQQVHCIGHSECCAAQMGYSSSVHLVWMIYSLEPVVRWGRPVLPSFVHFILKVIARQLSPYPLLPSPVPTYIIYSH
jgi:hypothetical protein